MYYCHNIREKSQTIDNCLTFLGMGNTAKKVKLHDAPADSSKILHADESGPEDKHNWNYCTVVECLNYIQAMTHPDLSYAVHQCACFCNTPKLSHELALKQICQDLRGTCSQVYSSNLIFWMVLNVLWMLTGLATGSSNAQMIKLVLYHGLGT